MAAPGIPVLDSIGVFLRFDLGPARIFSGGWFRHSFDIIHKLKILSLLPSNTDQQALLGIGDWVGPI
jgi:hypothetical protein